MDKLKKHKYIAYLIIFIVLLISASNNNMGLFMLALLSIPIVRLIYKIKIDLLSGKLEQENNDNLRKIRELEEKIKNNK